MSFEMKPETVAFIILLVAYFLGSEFARRHTFSKFERTFQRGDFDECLRQLDGVLLRISQPRYNQLMMRFNVYLALDDTAKASDMLDILLKMRLSKKQRTVLMLRAFNFFVENEDKERAKSILDELGKLEVGDAILKDCQRTYDILCAKGYGYIDEMTAELEGANEEQKLRLYFLLSEQYANKGSKGEAKRYRELAKSGMERLMSRVADDASKKAEAERAVTGEATDAKSQEAAQALARERMEKLKRLDRTKR